MNQGFALAAPNDWLIFWGSDDWAAAPHVLIEAISAINRSAREPDLLICQGRYADAATSALGRSTIFRSYGAIGSFSYRCSLWLGSTPPHQATLFGPGAREKSAHYTRDFQLSADLDYFLRLSSHSDLFVQCIELELVHMADGGISGRQTQRRLKEVCRAYTRAFGWNWWFPFIARYVRRLSSLVRL